MNPIKHQNPQRVGDNLIGTRYIFTLPLKDGGEKKVTLEPRGSATAWWHKNWRGKIIEHGSHGCWGYTDSDPDGLVKKINNGEFVLCDDGVGITGHQVVVENIMCVSESCTIPMDIDRKEYSAGDIF